MGSYDEYLTRTNKAIEGPQKWVSAKVIQNILGVTGLRPGDVDLLEIGTGTGRSALVAKRLKFRSYTGVEPTAALADYAERVHGLTIIRDSLPNLTSVNDSTYQVVFSLHVLEHAPTYIDAADWCNEMLRVVEPGGFVVVVAPNVIEWKSYFWDTDWSHGYPTTPKRVSQIFDDLQAQLLCEKTMHFGSLRILPAVFAQMINFILPARFVDFITEPLLKRRIGTGFKLAFTLGLTFVVVRKPDVIV